MKTTMMTGLLVAIAGTGVASGQLEFQLVNQIDLIATQDPASDSFIGSNPSTVAWDGTDMYVAGWNNGRGDGTEHGIVQIADAANSDALGTGFGLRPTNNFRGYLSLDVRDGRVAAAFENGGDDPQGLAIYDGATGTLEDSLNTRPTLANWDPANNGGNAVAWSQFGSGRLRVSDGGDLSNLIFDSSDGPVIFAGSTIQRGQDIDESGNIALADGGGTVSYFERTGANSTAGAVTIASGIAAGNGNNVSILNTSFGDFVLYNDRNAGNSFGDAVFAADIEGNAVSIDFGDLDTSIGTTGWFDYDYDAESGTLAVVEFGTRQAFVFNVVPTPSSTALLGLAGLAAARRRR